MRISIIDTNLNLLYLNNFMEALEDHLILTSSVFKSGFDLLDTEVKNGRIIMASSQNLSGKQIEEIKMISQHFFAGWMAAKKNKIEYK